MNLTPGTCLSYEDLASAARSAFADSELTQTALANKLGVTQSALSQALNGSGARFSLLQRRVVETLTGVRLVEITERYRVEPHRD